MSAPLMPKATAVWLVDNTAMTFEQIASFCGLHVLEVKGIADGDVAQGIKGMDPISSGQLTRDEIKLAEEKPDHLPRMSEPKVEIPEVKTKRGPKYTPVSRRQDRPNAILWLLRNHEELRDAQIIRLVGTTKPTIETIRDRSHWNSTNLVPQDPVTLALCSQIDLDNEVTKGTERAERARKKLEKEMIKAGTLIPTEETTDPEKSGPKYAKIITAEEMAKAAEEAEAAPDLVEILRPGQLSERRPSEEADAVFAKLGGSSVEKRPED